MTDEKQQKTAENPPLAMLEKRRIEAAIIKNIFDVLVEKYNREEAEEVIGEAVRKSAVEQGKEFREKLGREPELKDFDALLEFWEMGGALERKMLVSTPDKLEYDMIRCKYAEMYKEMGLADIGHLLSCNRDNTFCKGYNPKIKLTRTQTIMEGHSHCDFRYRMEKD